MCKFLCVSIVLLAASTPLRAQTYNVLHHFGSQTGDGIQPEGTITQDRNGAMLTMTFRGAGGGGSALRIWPGGRVDILHKFWPGASDPYAGYRPTGGLILATGGQFYGTTSRGGEGAAGTVFKMSSDGTVTRLYDFQGYDYDGTAPGYLVQSLRGDFYGTTAGDAAFFGDYGSVYRITKDGSFTLLHLFDGKGRTSPTGPPLQGTDNYFYGVTRIGDYFSYGDETIFRVSSTGDFKVLVIFGGANGKRPYAGLIQANDGNFYGVTSEGGSSGGGVLFRMKPDGTLTVLHSFTGASDGSRPVGGLVQASDGNLYGTNTNGGKKGAGVLFRATLAGKVVPLHDFDPASGINPNSAMLQHTNGLLYGDTTAGGKYGNGVFFSLNLGLPPFVTYLPVYGRAGALVQILGQGFTSGSQVSFNGKLAASPTVVSPTYLRVVVPSGATTGPITVTADSGKLTSNKVFVVHPN